MKLELNHKRSTRERIARYTQAFHNAALKVGKDDTMLRAMCRVKAVQAVAQLGALDRTDVIELPEEADA